MRELHLSLVRQLRPYLQRHGHIRGCLPGCSVVGHLKCHAKNRYFFGLDIKDAFRSVDVGKLASFVLCHRKTDEEETRGYLQRNFFDSETGGLVTGGPASQDLFNLYLLELVENQGLLEICRRYNLMYTRYLDDLLFSSSERIGRTKRKNIRRFLANVGLTVSERKTMLVDLKRAHRVEINGLGLEYGGRLYLPKHFLLRLNGKLHSAITLLESGQFDQSLFRELNGLIGLFSSIGTPWGRKKQKERKICYQIQKYRRLLSRLQRNTAPKGS